VSRSGAARWKAQNDELIAQFRASGGKLQRRNPVLLLTTVGARSGRPLTTPLNLSRDGDRLVVIASAGGATQHPAWYHNLVANPVVQVEHDGETFSARASVAEEPERTRLYDRQAAAMPFFDSYRRRVKSRQIPVVILERFDAEHPQARAAGASPAPDPGSGSRRERSARRQ
jgi:deazaflavin-dependent oxidoreductase (nitroreductase family)